MLHKRISLQEGDFLNRFRNMVIFIHEEYHAQLARRKVMQLMKTVHDAISRSPDAERKRVLVIEHLMSDDSGAEVLFHGWI